MTPHELLHRAAARGVSLWAEGWQLRYRGDRAAVEATLPELKAHKTQILALLEAKTGGQTAENEAQTLEIVTFDSFTLQSGRRVAFQLAIPRERYDGFELLKMLDNMEIPRA